MPQGMDLSAATGCEDVCSAEELGLQCCRFHNFEFNNDIFDQLRNLRELPKEDADSIIKKTERGTPLKPAHIGCILDPSGDLNDEIIDLALSFSNISRPLLLANGQDIGSTGWNSRALTTVWDKKMKDGSGTGDKAAKALAKDGINTRTLGDLDCIMVPCSEDGHWTLTLAFPASLKIAVLDSMARTGPTSRAVLLSRRVGEWLSTYMKGVPKWSHFHLRCPQQENMHDCGVHVALNAFCISQGFWPMAHNKISPELRRQFVAYMVTQFDKNTLMGGQYSM